jgi:5-hydroxyisourate hydrolase
MGEAPKSQAGGITAMAGYLTTHVLDTARGCPAAGLRIDLFRLDGAARVAIASAITNEDGRTDTAILPENGFETGSYELVFHAGDYLRATGQAGGEPLFLDTVPIRFGIAETAHYHVPLLLSPYGYSTYRGS